MVEKIFADNVRFFRRALNLSQEQLAEIVHIDVHKVRRIEKNEKNVSLNDACAIAAALGYDLGKMLVENEFTKTRTNFK